MLLTLPISMRKALITRKAMAPAVKPYAASVENCSRLPRKKKRFVIRLV